jgi:hypothetical protein
MLMLTGWAWAGEPCAGAPVVDGRVPQIEQGLLFQVGKAELSPEAEVAVRGLACLLQREPQWSARVEVYSDTRGAEVYNLRMCQARADAVRAALGEQGVAEERVAAVGYGESPQRRVEVYVGASPSADRPPAPVLPPAPVIPPAPAPAPIDWCARARAATAAVPRWSGASCAADGISWTCSTPQPPEELVQELSGCARVLEDGGSWYVSVPGGTLVLQGDTAGSRVSWR